MSNDEETKERVDRLNAIDQKIFDLIDENGPWKQRDVMLIAGRMLYSVCLNATKMNIEEAREMLVEVARIVPATVIVKDHNKEQPHD